MDAFTDGNQCSDCGSYGFSFCIYDSGKRVERDRHL